MSHWWGLVVTWTSWIDVGLEVGVWAVFRVVALVSSRVGVDQS
jgi:hypothetical protein